MSTEVVTIEESFDVLGEGSKELRDLAKTASSHLKTGFREIKDRMDSLENWKREYDSRSSIGKWWDNNILAEKRDEMILVTMESAKQQMDVVRFIAWLNTQMLALQSALNESQNQLKSQNVELQNQQKVIELQQKELEEQQRHMETENQKIQEGCDVLRKLRSIVIGHEQTIGTNRNGIDQLIVQLTEIYKDVGAFDKASKARDAELTSKLSGIRKSVDAAIQGAAKNTEKALRKNAELLSEAEAKFQKPMPEMSTAIQTMKQEIKNDADVSNEFVKAQTQKQGEKLEHRVAEVVSGLETKADQLKGMCEKRVDGFEERVTTLASRCESAELRSKRLFTAVIVLAASSVAALALSVFALLK